MMENTETKLKIKRLESIEDIDLLKKGDIINTELGVFNGLSIVLTNGDRITLLGRSEENIEKYTAKRWQVEAGEGKAIQKPHTHITNIGYTKKSSRYEYYNKILVQARM